MGGHPHVTMRIAALSLTLVVAAGAARVPALQRGEAVADAAMRGDTDRVRALLRDGADVNAAQGDGMTALHWTALTGDLEMARMLLYAGANVKASTRLGAHT